MKRLISTLTVTSMLLFGGVSMANAAADISPSPEPTSTATTPAHPAKPQDNIQIPTATPKPVPTYTEGPSGVRVVVAPAPTIDSFDCTKPGVPFIPGVIGVNYVKILNAGYSAQFKAVAQTGFLLSDPNTGKNVTEVVFPVMDLRPTCPTLPLDLATPLPPKDATCTSDMVIQKVEGVEYLVGDAHMGKVIVTAVPADPHHYFYGPQFVQWEVTYHFNGPCPTQTPAPITPAPSTSTPVAPVATVAPIATTAPSLEPLPAELAYTGVKEDRAMALTAVAVLALLAGYGLIRLSRRSSKH